jgi:ATP-dependent DNA ligase
VGRKTTLYSRRQNVLNRRFPYITKALDHLPDGTVVDGELVAMGPDGHPDFNLLQNFRSAEPHITYTLSTFWCTKIVISLSFHSRSDGLYCDLC